MLARVCVSTSRDKKYKRRSLERLRLLFVLWRRSDRSRSDAQYKLHREALVEAVDPDTADFNKPIASTQEGG